MKVASVSSPYGSIDTPPIPPSHSVAQKKLEKIIMGAC